MVSSVSSIKPSHSINHLTLNDLQAAIDANQTSKAIELLKKTPADRPLPNGQLPLHYAIRQGKLEIVEAMFKDLKLQLQEKDFQGLTSVDHALITQDPKMIGLVVGKIIGQEFDAARARNLDPVEVTEIHGIVNAVQLIRSGLSSVSLLHEAARKGNFDEVKKFYIPVGPNPYDENGLTVLHYAVLSGKKEIVEWLLQNGEKADVLTRTGHPLLFFACIGGHADMISYLIQTQKANPNVIDSKGRSLLHFAMALEDLSSAKALIQNGAHLFSKQCEGVSFSAFEMMLHLAKERSDSRDPLALSLNEMWMFAGAVAPWVAQVCGIENELLQEILPILGVISGLNIAYQSLKSPIAKAAYWGSWAVTGFASAAGYTQFFYQGDTTGLRLSLGLLGAQATWHSYHVGQNVIKGLGNCWSNRSLETYRPIRNAIVYSVIGFNLTNHVVNLAKMGLEQKSYLDAWDKHMEIEGDTFRNLKQECSFVKEEDGITYLECTSPEKVIRGRFINAFNEKWKNQQSNPSASFSEPEELDPRCHVDANICEGKHPLDCIDTLNPVKSVLNSQNVWQEIKCPNQAEIIRALNSQSDCKKAVRELQRNYHANPNGIIMNALYQNGKLRDRSEIVDKFTVNGLMVSDQTIDHLIQNPSDPARKIKDMAEVLGCK